ncbi:hypothetical protein DFH27DRAFT_551393 [Peziza echinospora]|nr:hypothetical protein DFH27DRAFT_551393 [Peziza echinospora]
MVYGWLLIFLYTVYHLCFLFLLLFFFLFLLYILAVTFAIGVGVLLFPNSLSFSTILFCFTTMIRYLALAVFAVLYKVFFDHVCFCSCIPIELLSVVLVLFFICFSLSSVCPLCSCLIVYRFRWIGFDVLHDDTNTLYACTLATIHFLFSFSIHGAPYLIVWL